MEKHRAHSFGAEGTFGDTVANVGFSLIGIGQDVIHDFFEPKEEVIRNDRPVEHEGRRRLLAACAAIALSGVESSVIRLKNVAENNFPSLRGKV